MQGKKTPRLNIPDRRINTRSEESADTVTAATGTLAAGLGPVHHPAPGLARDPANATIVTLTLRVRLLARDLPWMVRTIEVVIQE